jgi:hypothetical protein
MLKTKTKKQPILKYVLWSNDITGDLEEVYLLTSVSGGLTHAIAYVPPYIDQRGSQGSIINIQLGGSINKKTDFWISSDAPSFDLLKPNTIDSVLKNLKLVKKSFGKLV